MKIRPTWAEAFGAALLLLSLYTLAVMAMSYHH